MVDYVQYCPIWGEPHEASVLLRPEARTYEVSRSPRAGNGYKIEEVLINSSVRSLAPDEMERLATWLVDQRLQAVWIPEITQAVIDYVKQKRPLEIHERADRLLKHLARKSTSAAQIPHLRLLGWLLWAYSRCGVSTGVLIGLCAASLRGLATVSHQLWSLSG